MDRSSSFQIVHNNIGHSEYLVQEETTVLKKSNHECVEDNSFSFIDCINEFIADQLGCFLPWAKMVNGMRECTNEDDLESFRNLSIHLTDQTVKNEIAQKGCFKHNCRRTTWIKNQYDETWVSEDNSKTTVFFISVPATAKVLQRREFLIADFSTFVADCGSYLSLFLGASILSLTDIIISFFRRVSHAISDWISKRKVQN